MLCTNFYIYSWYSEVLHVWEQLSPLYPQFCLYRYLQFPVSLFKFFLVHHGVPCSRLSLFSDNILILFLTPGCCKSWLRRVNISCHIRNNITFFIAYLLEIWYLILLNRLLLNVHLLVAFLFLIRKTLK